MIRGTRNLYGKDAEKLFCLCRDLETLAAEEGYSRFLPSLLAEKEMFEGNIGDNRMFSFKDLADRDVVLVPEITAIARREFREFWSKSLPKPVRIFYTSRCYRYDRPQRGRYREFTQFGLECMPDDGSVMALAEKFIKTVGLKDFEVKKLPRDQSYYTTEGIEIWSSGLQIAGGGGYEEGAGFAIGVERLLLVMEEESLKGLK